MSWQSLSVFTQLASTLNEATCSYDGRATQQPLGDGMLLLRDAVPTHDLGMLIRAERQAWTDPFLAEHDLVNHSRTLTGSPSTQSVTWLHRHRAFAGGVFDRLEEAALAAQEAAGWALGGLGPLHVRCIESIRYSATAGGEPQRQRVASDESDEIGWHQDEWSVLTAVLTLAVSPDMEGGEMEVDRGGGPTRAEGLRPGDLCLFRSWDAHRSTPLLRGERQILVMELWQGQTTGPDSPEGRPAELHGGRPRWCGPALVADPSSAALLWFCSKAAADDAGLLLSKSAELVGGSAYLWELAAAALAIPLLDELRASGTKSLATKSFARMTAALGRAGKLRTAALVPDVDARPPPGWDEDEDGAFDAGFIDGVDGASIGGFFRQLSRDKGCGFPPKGLDVLRRRLAVRGADGALTRKAIDAQLREVVSSHPTLWNTWLELDYEYLHGT